MHLGLVVGVVAPELRMVLTVGVMGGFTTYSSFNYETLSYVQRGAWLLGLLYVAATVLGCFAAGVLGIVAGRALAGG